MKWETAIDSIGDIVIATDIAYGTYIGILEGLNRYVSERAKVRILACIEYPSQRAILQNTPKPRKPYKYCEIENFDLESVEPYFGKVPEYSESVISALRSDGKNEQTTMA